MHCTSLTIIVKTPGVTDRTMSGPALLTLITLIDRLYVYFSIFSFPATRNIEVLLCGLFEDCSE